ncbi:MAG: holo-ACP synthase [Bacillota bacterium]
MDGLGIDIVEIERIQAAVDRWGDRFLRRVFTASEIQECAGRVHRLAGRFAAKEAVAKALGSGFGRIGPGDIEVLPDATGRPVAQIRSPGLGDARIHVSISHSNKYAVAVATYIRGEAG